MFVQLRRVVYLLVLLQCCVCMVRAERGTTGNRDPAPTANELNAGMNEADEAVVNANACMEVWGRVGGSYKKNVSPVNDATREMKKVLGEIKKTVGHAEGKEGEPVTEIPIDIKEKEIAQLVEKAMKAIRETNDAADTAKESITKIRNAERFCAPYIDKVKQVKEKLEEKKKLEEEDKQKINELTTQINASVAAMEKAKMDFEILSNALRTRIEIEEEKPKNEALITRFKATNEKIKVVINTIDGVLPGIKKLIEPVETQEQVKPVKMDELEKAFEKEVQRLKAEKQSATEQERKEKEQTRGEEGKKPSEEKEEKGAQEQGAQANGDSKEKPQGNAEKETNTTAETNVQTTEAPVKERQEKGETTGDSTQKPGESLNDASSGTVSNISLHPIISGSSDNSNSPALMHSPLLLLLLCVLGSILVC